MLCIPLNEWQDTVWLAGFGGVLNCAPPDRTDEGCPNRWPESAASRIVSWLAFPVCGELSALVSLLFASQDPRPASRRALEHDPA
jgi:hypothetical protein